MASYSDYTKDIGMLTEYVRSALSRQISKEYADKDGLLSVITIDPEIENTIAMSIFEDPIEGQIVSMDPDTHRLIMNSMTDAYIKSKNTGFTPVFLVSPRIRGVTFSILERDMQDAAVLSYNEISPNIQVNVIATAKSGAPV